MGTLQLNRSVVRQVLASVDFGFTNPGVIQVWAIDGDGRMYLIHEIYQTGKTIDWWIEQAKNLKQLYDVERFICDPSEPAYIEQFNANGLRAEGAVNDIAPGISELQSRLAIAGDGRPRLFAYTYALEERDERRARAHQPYCFEQEIDAYAWPQSKDGQPVKEVPVKINDHSMDCARYMCNHLAQVQPSGGMLIPQIEEESTGLGWF